MEVNHEDEVVDTERFDLSREIEDVTLDSMQPAQQEVAKRLTTPIVNTYLDTKNIAFERYGPLYTSYTSNKCTTIMVYGFERSLLLSPSVLLDEKHRKVVILWNIITIRNSCFLF